MWLTTPQSPAPRMRPDASTLDHFRCFRQPQRVELRPITLLYGRNNAGKSALLRALPLVADSLRSDSLDALDTTQRLAPWSLGFDNLYHPPPVYA